MRCLDRRFGSIGAASRYRRGSNGEIRSSLATGPSHIVGWWRPRSSYIGSRWGTASRKTEAGLIDPGEALNRYTARDRARARDRQWDRLVRPVIRAFPVRTVCELSNLPLRTVEHARAATTTPNPSTTAKLTRAALKLARRALRAAGEPSSGLADATLKAWAQLPARKRASRSDSARPHAGGPGRATRLDRAQSGQCRRCRANGDGQSDSAALAASARAHSGGAKPGDDGYRRARQGQ
jgi:hypothetical protein